MTADFSERRAHTRFTADPDLPVVFSHARSELQAAGHIVDIGDGGLRLVGPPACPVPLVWNDRVLLTIGYSASARQHGMEGIEIVAVVVRVLSDATAFTVHARFREARVHARLRDYLTNLSDSSPLSNATAPLLDRR